MMSARLQSKRGCILNMDRGMSFMETVCSKRDDKGIELRRGLICTHSRKQGNS